MCAAARTLHTVRAAHRASWPQSGLLKNKNRPCDRAQEHFHRGARRVKSSTYGKSTMVVVRILWVAGFEPGLLFSLLASFPAPPRILKSAAQRRLRKNRCLDGPRVPNPFRCTLWGGGKWVRTRVRTHFFRCLADFLRARMARSATPPRSGAFRKF